MQILADGNRSLTVRYVVGKSLDCGNQYGIIRNKQAKVWGIHIREKR
jgi:hypothetical protein